MSDRTEKTGKSSALTDLTLEVRQSGAADQEVFLQHGLSLGRNASNTLCIDHPEVERIHAQVMRQNDGTMLLECASPATQVTLPDGKKVNSLLLKPGTTFKIGPATVRCLKRETKAAVVVTDNPWDVRCPRCHASVAELKHDARKCPECKTELFYFKEKTATKDVDAGGFQGWLPKQIGPYQIRAFVAQGGMGIVLRGLHQDNDMPAAVKLLKGDPDHDPTWKARFEAEINTLTSLKHPNVVRLQANGRDEKLLWLAMDWIDGVPLASWIAKVRGTQNVVPIEQIRFAMTQIISGLQYLHGRQIIHRDLKPSNILVGQDDSVKMVDFGIARTSTGSTSVDTRLTQTGMVTGTESYMAPEQAEGRDVTPASDVYALGVIWYELLTGRRPMGTFAAPEMARPETPPAWSRALSQCLSMDPRSRPTLDQLQQAISGMAAPAPIPAPVPPTDGRQVLPPGSLGPPPIQPYPAPGPQGPPNPGGNFGPKLQHGMHQGIEIAGKFSTAAAAGVVSFFRHHPPSQMAKKMGPVGVSIRKNPKIWIIGGVVAALVLVIVMISHLSDNPKPTDQTPTAANVPAQNIPAANPAAQGNQPNQPNPQQGNPAPPQLTQAQMAAIAQGAYDAAQQRMRQNVMYAQFLPLGNPNVAIIPQDAEGTFLVRSYCQGMYPGHGFGTAPFSCIVHRQPDGSFTADDPQY